MKYSMMLVMQLSGSVVFSQITSSKLPPVSDTFATKILASAGSFIRLAENPKKDIGFFTQYLVETNRAGQPVYDAPFPLPGFTANVRKIDVDRSAGLSQWMWTARFAAAPRGKKTAEIKMLSVRADSLLTFFESHRKYNGGAHMIIALRVNANFDWTWMPDEFAEITISFNKPSTVTGQQAYDSLVNLYKPLLFERATAKECSEKLGNAFGIERIPKEKITAFFTECIKEVANISVETAFDVMMAMPSFIDGPGLKAQLTPGQQASITTMAAKLLEEYNAREQRRINGVETVTVQQKKQVEEKQANQCDKIKKHLFPGMFTLGLAVKPRANNDGEIGWVSAVDCESEIVSITVPGVKRKTSDKIIKERFSAYSGKWEKNNEQFYLCSRCGGEGGETLTESTTRTKELPFGYFEGIRTTSTRTTTKTYWASCSKCNGTGFALEKK